MISLLPKKTKYNKQHRGRLTGKCVKNTLHYGDYGLMALEPVWLKATQIETVRKIITKTTKKLGQFWINVFPDKPITIRTPESRMGSGKGNVKFWVAVIKPGMLLFELKGIEKEIVLKLFKNISYKLPIKTKIIFKNTI